MKTLLGTNGDGSVKDFITSGNKRLVTKAGMSLLADPPASAEYSLALDGVNGVVSMGSPASLRITGTLSVSLWFNLGAFVSNTIYILAELGYDGTNTGYALGWNNGGNTDRLCFISYNGVVYGCELARVWANADAGTWHHVLGVWDGTDWRIFLDGAEDTHQLNAPLDPAASTARFALGAEDGNGTFVRFFAGKIDDAAVWAADQSSHAAALADGTLRPSDLAIGLRGYWKLDDGTGTSAADASGNGNTGTLAGGATWSADHPSQI